MIILGCIEFHLKGCAWWIFVMRLRVFINYALSNSKNINGGGIRCTCKKYENKKFFDQDVVTMHLIQKGFIEKYLCWFAHREPYIPYETIVKKMVSSTFNSSNVHGVMDDNINSYKSMVIDAMRMSKSYEGECLSVYKEPNTDVTRFFE